MKVLVTGASSQIGNFLLPRLLDTGCECYALSREKRQNSDQMTWLLGDLQGSEDFFAKAQPIDVWIHIAPIVLSENWLPAAHAAGVKRFIGFSTTSVFSKRTSDDVQETRLIERIMGTERRIASFCGEHAIDWVLFRPTLIYGCGLDNNVTFIEKQINKFGFFPVVGQATGLRQPVHADDLAQACLLALGKEQLNKAYNLSGAEILSYRDMVARIFQKCGKPVRFVKIPVWCFKAVLAVLVLLPRYAHINAAMVDRMNQDLVFDHLEATEELGFKPRNFLA